MAEFKTFFVVLPMQQQGLTPEHFVREKDANEFAHQMTKRFGTEHFVMEAKRVFHTRVESNSVFMDWDEINRLDERDKKSARAGDDTVEPPAPALDPPANRSDETF